MRCRCHLRHTLRHAGRHTCPGAPCAAGRVLLPSRPRSWAHGAPPPPCLDCSQPPGVHWGCGWDPQPIYQEKKRSDMTTVNQVKIGNSPSVEKAGASISAQLWQLGLCMQLHTLLELESTNASHVYRPCTAGCITYLLQWLLLLLMASPMLMGSTLHPGK